jgi:hypothetical protein
MTEWPTLPVGGWVETRPTLHRWTQIVGKIRLALAPPINHYWHSTLYVSTRGLTTSPIPYGNDLFEILARRRPGTAAILQLRRSGRRRLQ